MRFLLTTYCFLVLALAGLAQVAKDSALYITDAGVKDGIYLNYQDFRRNTPIYTEQVVSKLDKEQLEFVSKVMAQEKLNYVSSGVTLAVETKSVWGYFQNGSLYLNYKSDFYRVPVFGSISYLVANVTIAGSGFYDARFGPVGATGPTTEIREFLMNYYEGQVTEFSHSKAEELLARDQALYAEFKALGRKKRREKIYHYIRRYNELHPVYYLK